jgi:hypothetical protein
LTFALRKAFEDAGFATHRRNTELVARGLINHVRIDTDDIPGLAPGDIVPYEYLLKYYRKPAKVKRVPVRQAIGKYLQDHYLHHTIGTRLGPKMAKELEEFGIKTVEVTDEPPGFSPVMVGAGRTLQYDPDWMTRMLGSYQRRTVVQAAQTGATSDLKGTSFVPPRAYALHFGRMGVVRPSQPWSQEERKPGDAPTKQAPPEKLIEYELRSL